MTTSAPVGYSIGAAETAKRLGISGRTLDRMEKDGRLRPVSRIGGRRKYDAAQVEAVRTGLNEPMSGPAPRARTATA